MIAFPLLALIALTISFLNGDGWRAAFLRALIVFGTAAVLITEMAGALNALQAGVVAGCWTAVGLAVAAISFRRKVRLPSLVWPGWWNAALIAVSACIVGVILITALASAPNSTDAMAYHLPRVVYWVQAGNVGFFPTQYLNQIMLQPMAEYLMLHTYLLTGGDGLVNLVQWLGCVGSILGVSLAARALGAGVRGQTIAALFCATLPNGILQASGAKNDYVLTLWLVSAAWLAVEWTVHRRRADLGLFGLSIGLALFTKGTAYLFVPPLIMAVLWPEWRRMLPVLGVAAACVLVINGPHYLRNVDLSGSPLGFNSAHGNGTYRWRNDHVGWRATISNLLRNASEQMGSRREWRNQAVYGAVLGAHNALGLDANDPGTTWPGSRFTAPRNSNHETDANNFWHLCLIVLTSPFLLWRRSRSVVLVAASAAAFVLFCAYLKWQPFQARLLLPLFVLSAPAVGVALEMLRYSTLQILMCVFLLSGARLPLTQNWVRPLTGEKSVFRTSRQDQYFADLTFWNNKQDYLDTVAAIQKTDCKRIGIDSSRYEIEYPIQVLLLRSDPRYRFVHVGVTNASAKYPHDAGKPCIVVCPDCSGTQAYGTPTVFGRFLLFTSSSSTKP